jgi:hypothetical protein
METGVTSFTLDRNLSLRSCELVKASFQQLVQRQFVQVHQPVVAVKEYELPNLSRLDVVAMS